MLSKKKELSVELAFKIGVKLNLTDFEIQYYCLMVQFEQEEDAEFREQLLSRMNDLNPGRSAYDLSVDLFHTIRDWYHLVILELCQLASFRAKPNYVAEKLAISKVDAEIAIERLLRLGQVRRDSKGRLTKTHNRLLTESEVPHAAIRSYHHQHLEKVARAFDEYDPKMRVSSTDVIAMDAKLFLTVEGVAGGSP